MENKVSSLTDAFKSDEFTVSKSPLTFILGKDESGKTVVSNLEETPHLVIAGATGTGKSTLAHNILISLAQKASPKDVRFLLCDTKMLEFTRYNKLPHLLIPPVTDSHKIINAILWVETEAKRRIKKFQDEGCRSIGDYNDLMWEKEDESIPHIVLVVDDIASVVRDNGALDAVKRIAQNGRAVGIHLILVTQSPSMKWLSEIIRDLIPVRAVFGLISSNDEKLLLGRSSKGSPSEVGTMVLYNTLLRTAKTVHCFNITDYIIADATEAIGLSYSDDFKIPEGMDASITGEYSEKPKGDELLPAAVHVILETGVASISTLQRKLKLGYARAAQIVDEMEEKEIVGPFQGSRPRAILITKEQWEAQNGVDTVNESVTIFEPEISDENVVQEKEPESVERFHTAKEPASNKSQKWYQTFLGKFF